MSVTTDQEILIGLVRIVAEEAGIPESEVLPEKAFVADLDIDSLSMMTIVVSAEETFGVRIPDDDVRALTTVADAVAYIRKAQG